MSEITRHDFIRAFTQRNDASPMMADELLRRLDIILNSLKEAQGSGEKRLHVSAANSMRGALIRMAQAYDNADVTAKVNELIEITANITGI